jgi:hypothetical protein
MEALLRHITVHQNKWASYNRLRRFIMLEMYTARQIYTHTLIQKIILMKQIDKSISHTTKIQDQLLSRYEITAIYCGMNNGIIFHFVN